MQYLNALKRISATRETQVLQLKDKVGSMVNMRHMY